MKDRYRKLYLNKNNDWCFESDITDKVFYNFKALSGFDDNINIEYINKCNNSYYVSTLDEPYYVSISDELYYISEDEL